MLAELPWKAQAAPRIPRQASRSTPRPTTLKSLSAAFSLSKRGIAAVAGLLALSTLSLTHAEKSTDIRVHVRAHSNTRTHFRLVSAVEFFSSYLVVSRPGHEDAPFLHVYISEFTGLPFWYVDRSPGSPSRSFNAVYLTPFFLPIPSYTNFQPLQNIRKREQQERDMELGVFSFFIARSLAFLFKNKFVTRFVRACSSDNNTIDYFRNGNCEY